MTDEEIFRRLRAIRFSPVTERNARRAPSINALAKQAGLSREVVYEVIRTSHLGRNARARLTSALTCEENNRARSGV